MMCAVKLESCKQQHVVIVNTIFSPPTPTLGTEREAARPPGERPKEGRRSRTRGMIRRTGDGEEGKQLGSAG